MSDCRFGVSPVNYPDPDPDPDHWVKCVTLKTESHITSCIHLHWLSSIRIGDMMSLIAYYLY